MSLCSSETYSIDPLYICGICTEKFPITCLYTCDRGHLVCTRCFKQEYYVGKEKKCPYKHCNCWISRADKKSEESVDCLKKMFPCPWEISLAKKCLTAPKKSMISVFQSGEGSCTSIGLSRKPVTCPYYNCNKTIAVTTFYEHFRYEHPTVTFLDTKFETRNGLNFCLEDIRYNERHCILLINIVNAGSESSTISKIKSAAGSRSILPCTKPVLLAMAIRIHSFESPDDNDCFSSGDGEEDDSSVYDPHACTPDDRILIWIASNIITRYSYTLAVSTLCNEIRLKYYGAVLAMNEDPLKLCYEGRGLVMSNFHMKGMTANGSKPLVMDIIIHGEETPNKELSREEDLEEEIQQSD